MYKRVTYKKRELRHLIGEVIGRVGPSLLRVRWLGEEVTIKLVCKEEVIEI